MSNDPPDQNSPPWALITHMVNELRSNNSRNEERMHELSEQFHELNRQIHLLNFNLDRYVKIPERLERVERFVWIVGIVASLVGVVAGGVAQKLLTDALMRPAMNQEQPHTQNPTPPTTTTGP